MQGRAQVKQKQLLKNLEHFGRSIVNNCNCATGTNPKILKICKKEGNRVF